MVKERDPHFQGHERRHGEVSYQPKVVRMGQCVLAIFCCITKHPRVSLVVQVVKNLPAMKETRFDPWVRKIPWKREWQPTCLENPMDRGAWRATVHRVTESQTRLK